MIRYINLGCGSTHLPGWLNVDSNPNVLPDMVLDINNDMWRLPSDHYEHVLMDSVVEHLDIELVRLIPQIKRIMRSDGMLTIKCPNCFHWKARLRYLFGTFGANSGYHYDHRWLFKPSFLKGRLEYFGFEVNHEVSDLFDQEITIHARKRR